MENTLENKAKLFAQYWGQEIVGHNVITEGLNDAVNHRIILDLKERFLELKPLSSITDEDAKFCGFGNKKDFIKVWDTYGSEVFLERFIFNNLHFTDYLRSKGYALPYNGLSVDEQIECGWIKLKQ